MKAGYFFSDEPGYYEKGKFGIRLETVLMTVEKNDLPYGKFNNAYPVKYLQINSHFIMSEKNFCDRKSYYFKFRQ